MVRTKHNPLSELQGRVILLSLMQTMCMRSKPTCGTAKLVTSVTALSTLCSLVIYQVRSTESAKALGLSCLGGWLHDPAS